VCSDGGGHDDAGSAGDGAAAGAARVRGGASRVHAAAALAADDDVRADAGAQPVHAAHAAAVRAHDAGTADGGADAGGPGACVHGGRAAVRCAARADSHGHDPVNAAAAGGGRRRGGCHGCWGLRAREERDDIAHGHGRPGGQLLWGHDGRRGRARGDGRLPQHPGAGCPDR